jgi:transcriptional regulator with XRE-family HTH domain
MNPLRLGRLLKELTQIDLATRSGVPVGRIHLIERGRVSPGQDEIEKLAKALGVDSAALQGDGSDLLVGRARGATR